MQNIYFMHTFFDTVYEKIFFRDLSLVIASAIAVIGQIAMAILIIWNGDVLYRSGNEFLYLHYKIFMGVDYFARWYTIFLLPLSGTVCIGVNYILARALFFSHKSTAHLLMACAATFQYLLLLAIYLVIQINIF